jgi:hypothetical protein
VDQLLASPGFPGPASSPDAVFSSSRDGHETGKDPASMTKRSWLQCALAATRERGTADEFRQCAENTLRSNAISVRIRCTASTAKICTGETCRASLTRETSGPPDGARRGDNRGVLRTAAHSGRPPAGRGTAARDGARRARRRRVHDARRRARAATVARGGIFSNRPHRRSTSRARHETSRARSARVPALRLAQALGSLRDVSAVRQTSGVGGCQR